MKQGTDLKQDRLKEIYNSISSKKTKKEERKEDNDKKISKIRLNNSMDEKQKKREIRNYEISNKIIAPHIKRERKEINEINALINNYIYLSGEYKIDGAPVDSFYIVPNGQTKCEKTLKRCLMILDEHKNPFKSLYAQICLTEENKIRSKMSRIKSKILKRMKSTNASFSYENPKTGRVEEIFLSDFARTTKMEDFLNVALEKKLNRFDYSPSTIKLLNTKIEVDLDREIFPAFIEPYMNPCYLRLKEIENLKIKDKSNTLNKIEKLYKTYVDNYVAYKIIEFYLVNKKIKNHPKAIKKLEKIVSESSKKCVKLIEEADSKYNDYIKRKKIKNTLLKEQKENDESLKVLKTHDNTPTSETKINNNDNSNDKLSLLSLKYRKKYIQDKLSRDEIEDISYLEYLKSTCPNELELIKYTKEQKEVITIYKKYIKDRIKRISKKMTVISFRQFVEKNYNKDFQSVMDSLPSKYQDELNKIKAK